MLYSFVSSSMSWLIIVRYDNECYLFLVHSNNKQKASSLHFLYDKNRESVSWEEATCPQLILDYKYSGSLNVVDMKRLPEIESLFPIGSF